MILNRDCSPPCPPSHSLENKFKKEEGERGENKMSDYQEPCHNSSDFQAEEAAKERPSVWGSNRMESVEGRKTAESWATSESGSEDTEPKDRSCG